MSEWAAKRFWKEAGVSETDQGFGVHLDGRRVRTPAKAELIVPTHAMAQAIATEWDAQDSKIVPDTMPVTRAANAAIDKVAHQHAEVARMIADYGDSDLLCYRAESPAELAARQAEAWIRCSTGPNRSFPHGCTRARASCTNRKRLNRLRACTYRWKCWIIGH